MPTTDDHAPFCMSVWFDSLRPSQQFSVMWQVFLGWASTKQRIKCLSQGHNTATLPLAPAVAGTNNPLIQSNQLSHCTPQSASLTYQMNNLMEKYSGSVIECLTYRGGSRIYLIGGSNLQRGVRFVNFPWFFINIFLIFLKIIFASKGGGGGVCANPFWIRHWLEIKRSPAKFSPETLSRLCCVLTSVFLSFYHYWFRSNLSITPGSANLEILIK